MVCYKCEKCNKEFNQKSNYVKHLNRKTTCIKKLDNEHIINNLITYKCIKCNKEFNNKYLYDKHINKNIPCNNILIYKCNRCNKEFNKKSNYNYHISRKIPCKINDNNLINDNKMLNNIINDKNNIINLLNEKIKLLNMNTNTNINITNTNNTNNTNNNIINNTNNTINIKLVNFGQENYTKLTKEEKQHILKYSKQSMANLIKYLHINDRIPEYKNVCVKNLRGKGGYLYEGNKWMHLNYNILLMILFKNKINDLDKILAENENLNISSSKNIKVLIDNYTDDMDTFIKNNKENIINMLYNHTKNYKIE